MAPIPAELDFVYRPRKSYQASPVELAFGVVLLFLVFACLISIGVVSQVCIPPGNANLNGTLLAQLEDSSNPKVGWRQCWWYGLAGWIFFVVFVASYALSRAFVLQTFIIYHVLLFCFIPAIIVNPFPDSFEYFKLFSVVASAIVISLYRLSNMFKHMKFAQTGYWDPARESFFWSRVAKRVEAVLPNVNLDGDQFKWIMIALFAFNIMEAVVYDGIRGHYGNVAAGVWLVLAIPRGHMASSPFWRRVERKVFWYAYLAKDYKHVLFVDNTPEPIGLYDGVLETDWFWVFMYCTWNAAFSYDERKEHFVTILLVLAAACFTGANIYRPFEFFHVDPHLFVQARVYTLATRYSILAFYDVYQEFMDSSVYFNPTLCFWWGIFNCGCIALYIAYKAFVFTGEDSKGELDSQPPGVITEERRKSVTLTVVPSAAAPSSTSASANNPAFEGKVSPSEA